jgi:hypothetical protein
MAAIASRSLVIGLVNNMPDAALDVNRRAIWTLAKML